MLWKSHLFWFFKASLQSILHKCWGTVAFSDVHLGTPVCGTHLGFRFLEDDLAVPTHPWASLPTVSTDIFHCYFHNNCTSLYFCTLFRKSDSIQLPIADSKLKALSNVLRRVLTLSHPGSELTPDLHGPPWKLAPISQSDFDFPLYLTRPKRLTCVLILYNIYTCVDVTGLCQVGLQCLKKSVSCDDRYSF